MESCKHFPCLPSLGDISPPRGVRVAMEMQAEAERKKRAQVLESEGNEVCSRCQVFPSGYIIYMIFRGVLTIYGLLCLSVNLI